ncbi:MAG: substrate-binding domain-containing protein [Lachnospiraceae bacterium]
MKRWKGYFLLGVLLLMACVVGIWFLNSGWETKDTQVHQLSYVYRGGIPEESQQAVKQGLEQASNDFKVEITTVAPNDKSSVLEQLELIEKEVKNGADAILIEPIKNPEIEMKLQEIEQKVPVIEVNSAVSDKKQKEGNRIRIDNYEMGQKLGHVILKRVKPGEQVVLLKSDMEYTDVEEQYKGVSDVLTKQGIAIEERSCIGEEREREMKIQSMMHKGNVNYVVAFDSTNLELLGKVKKENVAFKNILIYGMGRTNQIIAYIEEGTLQAIGVSNEYSVGYLSAQKAVQQIREQDTQENEIGFSIIEKDNLYTTENQRLLFPFVQ